MRSLTISLAKELLAYCSAHSDMVIAEAEIQRHRNIGASIRLTEATDRFEKQKERLLKKLPDGISLSDLAADFTNMIIEAQNDIEG